jgi:alpha-beta hydrolase superfamily lysophospholipase
VGARSWTLASEDGTALAAWELSPVDKPRGVVLLGHGYRDDRRQLLPCAERLARAGFTAVVFDFRAHGGSEGVRITIGRDEARDVRAMLAWGRAQGLPVGYLGFSMGAAAYLLADTEADAAVLDSPYDTLDNAFAARLALLGLGALTPSFREAAKTVTGLDPAEARPVERVGSLRSPTLVLFAPRDRWLPGRVRERYRTLAAPSVQVEALASGGHSWHFDEAWHARVLRWFDARLAPAVLSP